MTTINGWEKTSFGEIATLVKGVSYASEDYCGPGQGAIFLTIKCVSKAGGFKPEGIKYFKGKIADSQELHAGDLLIANTDLTRAGDIVGAPIVVPSLNGETITMSMDLSKVVEDDRKIDRQFFYFMLMTDSVRRFMKDHASGSTVLHLQTRAVPTLEIDIPNKKPEQTKIAEILSTVDQAIDQTEALIAKQQRIKTGLMQDLLTRGIDKQGNLRSEETHEFKDSSLGRIPVEWESGYFQSCISGSPQNGIYKPQSAYGEQGTPIIRIDGFGHGDRIKAQSYKRIGLSKSEIEQFRLRDGEVLINRVNSVQYLGKTALVEYLPEATVFESNMMRLTIDRQRMLPDFALLILTSPAASGHFLSNAKLAIAQASINQHDVNSLQIKRPHLKEQCAICERIASIDDSIRNTLSGLEKLHRVKTALMQDLLTGEVSVASLLTDAKVRE